MTAKPPEHIVPARATTATTRETMMPKNEPANEENDEVLEFQLHELLGRTDVQIRGGLFGGTVWGRMTEEGRHKMLDAMRMNGIGFRKL